MLEQINISELVHILASLIGMEWSKQRHVDHVALIYFQKMLQVLTSHTSKLPKKVLKNTKNMTPNSCSVRPEKFHPYVGQINSPTKTKIIDNNNEIPENPPHI